MKKKLAQILAVVLAVSCFSGCEFLLAEESYNESESGYLESVELGDSGSSGNEITVDIESEKVNSEAEWNAAFDFDLFENYVVMLDIPLHLDVDKLSETTGYSITAIDKKSKKVKYYEYVENDVENGSIEMYYTEKDEAIYGYYKSTGLYDGSMIESAPAINEGKWVIDADIEKFEDVYEDYLYLYAKFLFCADCQNRYNTTDFGMTECAYFSYENYIYDEEEKVYVTEIEEETWGRRVVKICFKEGRIYAILISFDSFLGALENVDFLYLIGAADIELPPFEYEAEDSSQESA